jgi:hypothetical protein
MGLTAIHLTKKLWGLPGWTVLLEQSYVYSLTTTEILLWQLRCCGTRSFDTLHIGDQVTTSKNDFFLG